MTNQPTPDHSLIPPGSTIGILGGGQLGRMMTIAAKQMGYRVHIYTPSVDSPAGQVADLEIEAKFDDGSSVEAFARDVDVVTLETENIPVGTLEIASQFAPCLPGRRALAVSQNRILEKQFLDNHQIPTCRNRVIRSARELQEGCQELLPSVLKSNTGGYDGKGQRVIRHEDEIARAWHDLSTDEAILEELIDFEFEFSVIGARNATGQFTAFPAIRNEHEHHVLNVSISPAGLTENVEMDAAKIVETIMRQLDAVGVMTVEFFYAKGRILVNEIAPRPHNSGHLTIEAHQTSQFEQHIRAICGLNLGSTRQLQPAAMANLLGDQWEHGRPHWHLGLAFPNTKLHLYGKDAPELGRKMGHLTALSESTTKAMMDVASARDALTNQPSVPLTGRATAY